MSEICRVLFLTKFEKLVHLVGFIIRIYHDVQSSECQIRTVCNYTGRQDMSIAVGGTP